jgi:hypothetical protein
MVAWRKLALPALIAVGLAALFLRIDAGIWDPWEMNRAHVARGIAGQPKVLVVGESEALFLDLSERFGQGTFFVDSSVPPLPGPGPKKTTPTRPDDRATKKAEKSLEAEVFHGAFIQASLLVKDPTKAAAALETFRNENPATAFFLVAPGEPECEEVKTLLEGALVRQAGEKLRDEYHLLPGEADLDKVSGELAGTYPFTLAMPCLSLADEAALASALEKISSYRWTRVQFKGTAAPAAGKTTTAKRATYLAPPLDYWLCALSYKAFGFSETSSRLPGLLFGLLTILVFAWGTYRLAGRETAIVATLILMTVPMFLGQSKNMAGEASYAFFLTACVVLFGLLIKEGFRWPLFGAFLVSALLLFLAKGLFGLLCILLLLGAYILVTRDFRGRETLLPTGTVLLLFGLFMLLVQLPDEPTFFSHFKLMNRLFLGGPESHSRTFEYFLRQTAFGLMPWALLVPVALARLIPMGESAPAETGQSRLELLVFLWFSVPFALHSALLPDFLHLVFPAAAAAALAIAFLWSKEAEEEKLNRFQAVVALGIAAVLLANLLESPRGLVTFLTNDPQFGGEKGQKFPPEFLLAPAGAALLLALAALVFVYYIRGGTLFVRVVRFFRGGKPFWAAAWVCAILFVVRLVAGMSDRYVMALAAKDAAPLAPEYGAYFAELLAGRLETVMLYLAVAVYAGYALWRYTRLGERAAARLRWLAPVGRGGLRVSQLFGQDWLGLPLAGGLAAAAVIDMLVSFDFAAGFWTSAGRSSALWTAAGLALVVPALLACVRLVGGAAGRSACSWGTVVRAGAGTAVLALLVFCSLLFRQTDLSSPDIWVLALASFCVLGVYALCHVGGHKALFHLLGWLLLAAVLVLLFVPLAIRWPRLEAVAFPRNPSRFLRYLFVESRLTWIPVGMLLLVAGNRLVAPVSALLRKPVRMAKLLERLGGWNPARWPEQIEKRSVALPLVLMLSLGFALYYGWDLLHAFSREVSQKHILELYYQAEQRTTLGEDIFKYQQGGAAGQDDGNFYTAQIPAVTSQQDLNRVLMSRQDTLVKVSRSSSHPGSSHVLVRGFAADNDSNQDGVRDQASDAGIATAVAERTLEDTSKDWQPDQWMGSVLVDWRGNMIDVVGNDATTLSLALTVPIIMDRMETRRYTIDSRQAKEHKASAMERKRNYIVLSQEAFSSVNFSFRSESGGDHIPVLESSNVNFLLAASYLLEGEKNHNRFAEATIDRGQFESFLEWTKSPDSTPYEQFGLPGDFARFGRMKSGFINFDDKIKFHGYQLENTSLARGEKIRLRLFFECTGKVTTSWKVFIHMDSTGASNRINGDHWPLNMSSDPEEKDCVGCWRTNHWMVGDIILDDYQTEVPLGSPAGIYNVYMGFYTPGADNRLKVKEFDKRKLQHDGNDRVLLGSFEVH